MDVGKILVVDDDENILRAAKALLSERGYLVETANSGKCAIERTRIRSFDLALVDIVLPDMMGTQLLSRLEDGVPRMRKIIITGNPTLDNAIDAVNLGADAYIVKPVDPKELLRLVQDQLRKRKEDREMTEGKIEDFIKTRVKELKKSADMSVDVNSAD